MVTLDQVREFVFTLPNVEATTSYGFEAWAVSGRKFANVRPLSKADIKRLAPEDPPGGDTIAVVTCDMEDKAALLKSNVRGFFDIEHLINYPMILIALSDARISDVKASIKDAWRFASGL